MKSYAHPNSESTRATPLTISTLNCVVALGVPWRWTVEKARELGVPIWTVAGKRVIPAAALLAAFERAGIAPKASESVEPGSDDELAAMRERVRVAGGAR